MLLVVGEGLGNSTTEPPWDGVQGTFGIGKINESGVSVLSFCAMNQLCVMNVILERRRECNNTLHSTLDQELALY